MNHNLKSALSTVVVFTLLGSNVFADSLNPILDDSNNFKTTSVSSQVQAKSKTSNKENKADDAKLEKKYVVKDTYIYSDKDLKEIKTLIVASTPLNVKEVSKNVCEIADIKGYISQDFLIDKVNFGKIGGTLEIKNDTKVFKENDVTSAILGDLKKGETIPYEGKFSSWYKIKYTKDSQELTGYVYIPDIETSTNKEQVSIEDEDTIIEESLMEEGVALRDAQANSIYGSSQGVYDNQISSQGTENLGSFSREKMTTKRGRTVYIDYDNETQRDIAKLALNYEGGRYIWGGNSLSNGVDCSGFTRELYKRFGILIPRSSSQQYRAGRSVSLSNLRAGDIIRYSGHVGLYLGNGQMIHASTPRSGIIITPIRYGSSILGATRVFN